MTQNPDRVPPALEVIDPHQEGTLRTIHPIGSPVLHVGTVAAYLDGGIRMDRPDTYHIVKTSEVLTSRDGKSRRQFAEGTKVSLATAYDYGLVDDAGVALVRPEDEKPDVADNDDIVTFRSEGAAPENRMEPAPENRKKK